MISPLFRVTGEEAKHFLPGLVNINVEQLREHPGWPSVRQLIDQGKIRYRLADPQEHWQTYKELVDQVKSGGVAYADCEDLASAVAAEDRVRHGVMTEAWAYKPRPGLFHVVAAVPQASAQRFGAISKWPLAYGATRPGFVLQDPSAAAGMGSNFSGTQGENMSFGWDGNLRRTVGSELGAGLREGLGIRPGWIRRAGAQLGSSLREAGEGGLDLGGLGLGGDLDLDDDLSLGLGDDGLGDDGLGDDGLGLEEDDQFGFLLGALLAGGLLSQTKKGKQIVRQVKGKISDARAGGSGADDGPIPMAPTSEAAAVDELLSDGASEPGVDISDAALEAEMAELEAEFFGALSELREEDAIEVGEAVYGAVRSCDRYGGTRGGSDLEDAAIAEALDHYGLLDEETDTYAGFLSRITSLPKDLVHRALEKRGERLERRSERNEALMDRAEASSPPAGTSFRPGPLARGGIAPMDQVRVEAAKELTAPQVHRRIEARAEDAREAIREGRIEAAQASVAKIEQLLAMARKLKLKLPPLKPSTRKLLHHARGSSTSDRRPGRRLPASKLPRPRLGRKTIEVPVVRFGASSEDGLDELLGSDDGLDELLLEDELGLDELGLDELGIVGPMAADGFRAARAELI